MSSRCTVCRHPLRVSIDQDLLAGVPYRKLAAQHNLSPSALCRHTRHLARDMETTRHHQDQHLKREILDRLDLLIVRLDRTFQAAHHANSLRVALDCVRESVRVLQLMERFRTRLSDHR
ncbi:MAG: hypothetical protein P8X65_13875 [Syntrophobacterales bacterium]|jgi:hypothetical protein